MRSSGWPQVLPRPENGRFVQYESLSSWFEIRAVTPDTFAFLEPRHIEEVISYLILGERRAVLLDTGMGIADIRAEVERLTHLPITVVTSHSHFDHVGGHHLFKDIRAYDLDASVAKIERGLTPEESAPILAPGNTIELPTGFTPAAYRIRPAKVTCRLRHGDLIDLGGRILEVHHTPGHSPDEITVFDSLHSLLFTGDMYYPGALYADNPDSDLAAYARSAAALVDLLPRVQGVCPSHNLVWQPPGLLAQLDAALKSILAGEAEAEMVDGETAGFEFGSFRILVPHRCLSV